MAAERKIVDLFAGVGGMSLGAARAGFSVALAIENDRYALKAHKSNFPNTDHWDKDVSLISGAEILARLGLSAGELDGIIGGPPCQGFSDMGHGEVDDPRNQLFVKFFELVSECRPKFYIAENVPGILNNKYATIRETALERLAGQYHSLPPLKLNASEFGAPTTRERVFFIGYRQDAVDEITQQDIEGAQANYVITVAHALQGLPEVIDPSWQKASQGWQVVEELPATFFYDRVTGVIPTGVGNKEAITTYCEDRKASGFLGTRHSPSVQQRYRDLEQGEKDDISKSVRLRLGGFCPTLRAGTSAEKGSYQAVRPIHPIQSRVITPREAARLQGFPDWFQFDETKWHSFRQIGNSVSPLLAEKVLNIMVDRIRE
ncbi:DNA cytosine methyltransferase [Armatimonas sp.]|uniref:DNA cytosine methyltransferase n=1 Tax=Armatimonas sp. TaxID=1872638 RepID=UPI00374DE7C9